MAVYVDAIFVMASQNKQANFVGTRTGHKWCHMFADSVEELHEMADKIGLKRAWFQAKKDFPHYDLVPSKRAAAVKLGAKEVNIRDYLNEKYELNL